MQVGRGRAAGVGHDFGPTRDAVEGHLDQVALDRAPAVRGRPRPGEEESVASPQDRSDRPEARGRARNGDIGGCADDARPSAPVHPVDRRDSVVAGAAGAEAGVGVCGGCGLRVGLKRHPAAASGAGHFDPVAGDRASSVGEGRSPAQRDHGCAPGRGGQPPGCVRHAQLRRRAVDIRGAARSGRVDRRHPVVAGGAPGEAGVTVAGRRAPGIAQSRPPRTSVRRPFDPVSCDRAPAVLQRGVPVQFDHRGAVGDGLEVARRPGRPGGRRVHIRRGPRAEGVHRPDPVSAYGARRSSLVPVHAHGRVRPKDPGPAVHGHVDLIVGDRSAAVP